MGKLQWYRAQNELTEEKLPINMLHIEANMKIRNLVQFAIKWSWIFIENKENTRLCDLHSGILQVDRFSLIKGSKFNENKKHNSSMWFSSMKKFKDSQFGAIDF